MRPSLLAKGMAIFNALENFFSQEGPLAELLANYRMRDDQLEMSKDVATCLNEGGRLLVEGGTGTGKSLAYLSAALLSDQQLTVSTATKALQDQLIERDIPMVLKAIESFSGEIKTAIVMKGRQNYLCKMRLERFRAQPRFVFSDDAKVFDALLEFADHTRTGDRAELAILPDDYATWSELDAGADTCIGTACSHYDDCFITKMRKDAEAADVVVVNHHLLCADLRVRLDTERQNDGDSDNAARGFAQVIPRTDGIIVDEAHALPDVAADYFSVHLKPSRFVRLQKDIARMCTQLPSPKRLALEGCYERAQDAVFEIVGRLSVPPGGRITASDLSVNEEDCEVVAELFGECAAMLEIMAEGPHLQAVRSEVRALSRRCDDIGREIAFLFSDGLNNPDFVTFTEKERNGKVSISCSPIDMASALDKSLFDTDRPIVLASATLTVGNDQGAAFQKRIGLEGVKTRVFDSPFDFKKRASLYAPKGMPAPNAPDYERAFHDEARFLIDLSQGGVLMLFTSHRALRLANETMTPSLVAEGYDVGAQGDAPKGRLLDGFRQADEAGRKAVLMATHSFWEGVDIPGAALRMVIIDRLPFRSPGDPMFAARSDLIRLEGGHPFSELAIPEAALVLKQGVGRLMRSEKDAGVVAILDGRLREKSYGRTFLGAMPPFTRIGSRETLAAFWQRFVAPSFEEVPDTLGKEVIDAPTEVSVTN